MSILLILTTGMAMAIPGNTAPEKIDKTLDEKFLDVATDVPGFGGMFVDGDTLKVYLSNPSQKPAAETVIASIFGRERVKNVQILKGKYGFSQLKEWNNRAGELLNTQGTVYTDVDEKENRLKIGVDDSDFKAVEKRLDQLGIPREAVIIEKADPIEYKSTLRDNIRPIQGGLQIAFSNYLCSEGFNGVSNKIAGFVTASHCTNKQGGVEGTKYYQNYVAPGNLIGTEILDPYYTNSKCQAYRIKGKVCRYSDSEFSSLASGVTQYLGLIEKTDGVNTGSLTIASSFRITSEGPSKVGQTVNKVGRTTGWSQGTVTGTCVNVGVSGTNIVQLCQDMVTANVGPGDSGSPVIYKNPSTDDVELRGILWGGNSAGTLFVYSPIANIQRSDELGLITTCATGFSC
ncbi:MAG: hypothetical protein J5U19_12470 [Candidatus Methanoperedens sp.]|nr:hypothetical protein [Candidatus Methanoperedens sp.]